MSINVSSNFLLSANLPLDQRTVALDVAARNAIPPIQRYVGLPVFLTSTNEIWQLQGGILDVNWVLINSGGAITGTGIANSIAYWSSTTALAASANLARSPTTGVLTNTAGFTTLASPTAQIRYVDSVLGSNSNSGLSPGAGNAWQTLPYALSQQPQVIGGIYEIHLADGTYGGIFFKDILGNAADTTYGNNVVKIIGNLVTPANVVIQDGTNPVNIMNGRSVLVLDGVTLDGGGTSNGGVLCFNGVFDLVNVNIQNCTIGVQMNEAARGRWLPGSTGGNVTATSNGFVVARGASFSLQRNLTISGFSNIGISILSNAVFGITNTVTTLSLVGEAIAGAAVGIQSASGALISSSATTINISNVNLASNGIAIRTINNGAITLSNGATINFTNCTRAGEILARSYYQDGSASGNTYNYSTTALEWRIDSNSLVFAPGNFSGAVIKAGNQAGYVLGTMWRKQGTTTTNFTLNSQSHSIKCNPSIPITGILPLASDMGNGRVFVIGDVSGTAATNTITLQASGGDLINGQSTFVLDINWGEVTLEAITGGWSAT